MASLSGITLINTNQDGISRSHHMYTILSNLLLNGTMKHQNEELTKYQYSQRIVREWFFGFPFASIQHQCWFRHIRINKSLDFNSTVL
ncbi:hypothetical protein GDO81_013876 [Engystomops pustulosus]|uniref:Maturase K n=1 Tax=Engystomops pustulosus TaxID=76066 RepID=A0AAV7B684_ENGPU|nr:hypothetical protein GDO81_013876 [Engystomops pustulosus]